MTPLMIFQDSEIIDISSHTDKDIITLNVYIMKRNINIDTSKNIKVDVKFVCGHL